MTAPAQSLHFGTLNPAYQDVADFLSKEIDKDPHYGFQLAVYAGSELVVDGHGGSGITADSLMVPFSVSKNSIAFSLALLVERGQLDVDLPVTHYWPEFGAEGKDKVLVRELFSHQAGLPQTMPRLTEDEGTDPIRGGARLAAQLPLWRPGSGFGYHALTIGLLGSELVRRITGQPLQEFFEDEIRAPRSLDFFLGLPEAEEHRVVELEPMDRQGLSSEVPFVRQPGQLGRYTFAELTVERSEEERRAHARMQRSVGQPAAYSTVSARGIASLFAECVVGVSGPALISTKVMERMAQRQVSGTDSVIGIERAYGVVFQKPTPNLNFGGFRAFGHDGAGGALGFHDPETSLSMGYTVRRTPPPGGADARALHIAQLVQSISLGI